MAVRLGLLVYIPFQFRAGDGDDERPSVGGKGCRRFDRLFRFYDRTDKGNVRIITRYDADSRHVCARLSRCHTQWQKARKDEERQYEIFLIHPNFSFK